LWLFRNPGFTLRHKGGVVGVKKSALASSVAVFAALNVVCDVLLVPQLSSGVWYGLVFLIEPITGIVLGPYGGFLSTFIGVMVGHTVAPRGIEEFLFTLGAPIGAAVAGLLFRRGVRLIFIYYTALLASYFVTPVAWQLPLWGMWDVYCAYLALLIAVFLLEQRGDLADNVDTPWFLALCAFIGLEADILYRIFVLIPCQTYRVFYSLPVDVLQGIWVAGALITPLKVATASFLTTLVGRKLLQILQLRE
jgi:hypothetical protein